jgi:hypothetical protein
LQLLASIGASTALATYRRVLEVVLPGDIPAFREFYEAIRSDYRRISDLDTPLIRFKDDEVASR